MLNTFELIRDVLATLEVERWDEITQLASRFGACSTSIELNHQTRTIVAAEQRLRVVNRANGSVLIKTSGNNLHQLLLGNRSLIDSLDQGCLTVIGNLEDLGVVHDVFLVLLNLSLASARSAELFESWSPDESHSIHRRESW